MSPASHNYWEWDSSGSMCPSAALSRIRNRAQAAINPGLEPKIGQGTAPGSVTSPPDTAKSPRRCDQTEALKIRRNKSPREALPMYLSSTIDPGVSSIPTRNGRRHGHCSACPYSCSSLPCPGVFIPVTWDWHSDTSTRESHPDTFPTLSSVFSLPGILLRDHCGFPEVWGVLGRGKTWPR